MNNKRKNQKGFTLIELLAVVVILLAISVMAISSISAAIERNKEKQNNTKKAVIILCENMWNSIIIISYAELYYEDHKNTFTQKYPDGCMRVKTDLELTQDEKTDADGHEFEGYVCRVGNTFVYKDTK